MKEQTKSNDLSVQRANVLALADVMLEQTSAAAAKILCKKGVWTQGSKDVGGQEYIAYPMDSMRGFARWEDDRVVEQRIGRIADKFSLKREDLPANEDWQPQICMPLEDPETGEVFAFVSSAAGAKIAVEKLIHQVATALKSGRGTLTPLVRLGKDNFQTGEFGLVTRPAFEIVPRETKADDFDDDMPPF